MFDELCLRHSGVQKCLMSCVSRHNGVQKCLMSCLETQWSTEMFEELSRDTMEYRNV